MRTHTTTSTTKNVKGNRKVVAQYYHPPPYVFEIPDGLDLEDKTIVEKWYVHLHALYIKYVGKEEPDKIEAQPYEGDDDGALMAHNAESKLESADDVCHEYECDLDE